MDDNDSADRPDPPTTEDLVTRLDDLEAELAKAKRSVVWEALACSSVIATLLALVVVALWTSLADQGPTTADDDLDRLLSPGPHCYHSSAELAAARQRALTAVDRMRWEREFTKRWDDEHPQPAVGPISMIPSNVDVTPSPPPLPMIIGPRDRGVPPASDRDLSVRDDLCFGIPRPGA